MKNEKRISLEEIDKRLLELEETDISLEIEYLKYYDEISYKQDKYILEKILDREELINYALCLRKEVNKLRQENLILKLKNNLLK